MQVPVQLLSIATQTPPHRLRQAEVGAAAERLFGSRFPLFRKMERIFDTSGIQTRYSVRPIEWFCEPRGWPERTEAYLEGACALFVQAAGQALQTAKLDAHAIDIVVTVSSTGLATPPLDARAAAALGLRADVLRVPVFGLGCAGGTGGLAIAAALARATPGALVLLVVVELCTLAFRLDELTKVNIVATALFGDGAAACLLRAETVGGRMPESLAEVESWDQHTWPDTLDLMGWRTDGEGLGVVFANVLPEFALQNVASAVALMLGRLGLERRDLRRFICHPGGAKILIALERALALDDGALRQERAVLSDYGNMSAPTVLFVLERHLREGVPGRSAMLAMGPGFSASCVMLNAA